MLALAATDDQVDDVLKARELLAAPADEVGEILATDVEPRGFADAGDLDGAAQTHQLQHLLEDRLAGLECRALLVGELLERLAGNERRRLAALATRLARGTVAPRLPDRVVSVTAAAVALTPAA